LQKGPNFIEKIIKDDLQKGLAQKNLCFRFPPEPNGFLHIGHVKAICINFDLGETFNAPVNLRFDDTNPTSEEKKFVDGIKKDIKWLGYKWEKECYASDYFDELYNWAEQLITKGLAYIDSQDSATIAMQKGTPTEAGKNSPYRNRSKEDNLFLFSEMKKGSFMEGEHVLRAKIDMSSPNMLLRDPVMYRIIHMSHQRTNKDWCVYPMYDWAHGQSDLIEKISHSLCTLEFKPHRELYEWFLYAIGPTENKTPKQREFARLNLSYTITSKRKLKRLIQEGCVDGWDDPRMPTISGLRKRGYTPESLKKFVRTAGVAKRENIIELSLLEFCLREHLNKISPRIMAVLNPVKLIIENYPEGELEELSGEINPEDQKSGKRMIPFSKEIYIERDDFKENAEKGFFRLSLGNEVRLKNAYIIKAKSVEKDQNDQIKNIICTYDPLSKSGSDTKESKRKVKATIHWVCSKKAKKIIVNQYDTLFLVPDPDKHEDFLKYVNPNSLVKKNGYIEPYASKLKAGERVQFQRQGYFIVDKINADKQIIFNKTTGLRDSFKNQKKIRGHA
tara:strand:+ start:848 stop:2527 length:1680 start_codon:yes stop_codon:yes gene_type:complete